MIDSDPQDGSAHSAEHEEPSAPLPEPAVAQQGTESPLVAPLGKAWLDLEGVLAAVENLRAVGMNENQHTVFTRWIFRKRQGLTLTDPAVFTAQDCRSFARDWFETDAADGSERQYFNPLATKSGSGIWFGDTPRTKWHFQSLWSRMQQGNIVETALYDRARDLEAEGNKTLAQALVDPESYLATLSEGLGGKLVPIGDLAIWRFRYELLDETATFPDLIARLVDELALSPAERAAVFSEAGETAQEGAQATGEAT